MRQIIESYSENFKLWKYHLSLWFVKLISLWLTYLTFFNILNRTLNNRETIPYLWLKTDFSFLVDWVSTSSRGATSGLFGGIVMLLFVWFILDTIFDILFIGGLKKIKISDFSHKLWRMFIVRLSFWIPFILLIGASFWLTWRMWVGIWGYWPILLMVFIGSFVVLFLIKWIDMTKINVVTNEGAKLKEIFSQAMSSTFGGWKNTMVINAIFSIIFVLFVYLTIVVNLYFIATSASILWILWIVRQLMVLLRQVTRYSVTGVWIANTSK